MFLRAFHIVLTFIYLLASVGLFVSHHFCTAGKQKIDMCAKKVNCCCKDEAQSKNCCKDEVQYSKLSLDLTDKVLKQDKWLDTYTYLLHHTNNVGILFSNNYYKNSYKAITVPSNNVPPSWPLYIIYASLKLGDC
jgi:hypothetical protein